MKNKGGEILRTNLKCFRVRNKLSQAEIAKKLDVSRSYYGFIESGRQKGSVKFWGTLKSVFKLTDKQIKELKKAE